MASSRLTGINYMGLNELINMIYNFMTFCLKYYWLAFFFIFFIFIFFYFYLFIYFFFHTHTLFYFYKR